MTDPIIPPPAIKKTRKRLPPVPAHEPDQTPPPLTMEARTDASAKRKAMKKTKKSSTPPAPPEPPKPVEATRMKMKRGTQAREKRNEWGNTEREELFCQNYVLDLSGYQAAVRSGYSPQSARVQASDILTRPNIIQRIHALKREAFRRLDITHDRILRELSALAFANLADFLKADPETGYVHLDIAGVLEHAPHLMAGITGYEQVEMAPAIDGEHTREVLKHRIKMDKTKALELLMRHKGFFEPDGVLTPEQLQTLVDRQRAHLMQQKAILMAQLAIENKTSAGAGIPDADMVDIEDAEFETVEIKHGK